MIGRSIRQYMFIALVLFAATLFASPPVKADGTVPPIIPNTFVQDHSGVLTPAQRTQLSDRLRGLKQAYDIEIGLATVPDFGGFADEQQMATAMAREYKIGSATSKYGLLILVKTTDKIRYFLAPSIHTQGRLTDGQLGTIGRNALVPHLRQRDWAGAFNAALANLEPLLVQLKAESNTKVTGVSAPVADQGHSTLFWVVVVIAIILLIILVVWLISRLADTDGYSDGWISGGSSDWGSSSSSSGGFFSSGSGGDSGGFGGGGSYDGGGAGGGID